MIVNVDNPVIELHDLTITYNKKPALWGIDFTLPAGQLIGIVGPNGAGKSTLLKAIMGLLPLSSGYVEIMGKKLDDVRKKISYVPQRESVDWEFPASVMDVVLMGLYSSKGMFRRISRADKEKAKHALEKVKMLPFAKRQIAQLSGGQQQRVFLARALAQDADIYLMDEPFAGVDAASESAIFKILEFMRSEGKTIVVVHHDLQTAAQYFDWAILLNTRLVGSGPIDKIFTSELLQEAYGGKLTLLSQIGDLISKKELPIRE